MTRLRIVSPRGRDLHKLSIHAHVDCLLFSSHIRKGCFRPLSAIPVARPRSLGRNRGRAPYLRGWRRGRLLPMLPILEHLILPVDLFVKLAVLGLVALHKLRRRQSARRCVQFRIVHPFECRSFARLLCL